MVKKFAGKQAAIVGWEIDQVMRTPGGDISVPISASYNHHYTGRIIGAAARFEKVTLDGPDDPRMAELGGGHGAVAWDQPQYLVKQVRDAAGPVQHIFSSSNGGEYRRTYHGFAPGYALVLDSPTAMQITPMQIDTCPGESRTPWDPAPAAC
jgi:hypothetical protein